MVAGYGDGWGQIGVSRRNGIQPARGEGVAASQPADRQPRTLEDAKPHQRNIGILRAARKIEALPGAEGVQDRGQNRLVDTVDDPDREAGLALEAPFRRHGRPWTKRFAASLLRSGWHERH